MNPTPESAGALRDEHPVEDPISVLELPVAADAAQIPAPALAAAIEALSTALRDPDIRVLVLVLRAPPRPQPAGTAQAPPAQHVDALHDWLLALWDSDKPTLAALDSDIGGAGLALALACDLVVASRDVRLHLSPGLQAAGRVAAAAWLAARRLPPAQAAALALGCELDAPRAHAIGVLAELAEPGLARERAVEWASRIARTPGPVLAAVKQQLAQGATQSLAQALADERARCLRAGASMPARVEQQ